MNFWLKLLGLSVFTYLVFTKLIKFIARVNLPAFLNFFMKRVHNKISVVKEKHLKEAFEMVNTDNKTGKLEILELGIGTGENFRYFPANSNLTILDKTDAFLPYLKESINKHRNDLTISDLVVCSAENMNKIESNSMDVVIHTFVLCSIPNTNATLKEIYRVLK